MAINKVIYGGNVLLDLTGDTATASDVQAGKTFHDKTGELITGTDTRDSDTSRDTATASEILLGKTAHARGQQIAGTMPNNGEIHLVIDDKADSISIPQGYHDGSGDVQIDAVEKAKIIAENIKAGIQILGITGTYAGEADIVQQKTVTPATTAQTVLPDTGYDYLSQVNVEAIPYTETPNSAGGMTASIG